MNKENKICFFLYIIASILFLISSTLILVSNGLTAMCITDFWLSVTFGAIAYIYFKKSKESR